MDRFNYEGLSKYIENGETRDTKWHKKFLLHLNEFYKEDCFTSVYPKNFSNDEPDELIVFLKDGYIKVCKGEEDQVVYAHKYCKVVEKVLVTRKHNNARQVLTLTYDNGDVLEFNSEVDSNSDLDEVYSKAIRELYKDM